MGFLSFSTILKDSNGIFAVPSTCPAVGFRNSPVPLTAPLHKAFAIRLGVLIRSWVVTREPDQWIGSLRGKPFYYRLLPMCSGRVGGFLWQTSQEGQASLQDILNNVIGLRGLVLPHLSKEV